MKFNWKIVIVFLIAILLTIVNPVFSYSKIPDFNRNNYPNSNFTFIKAERDKLQIIPGWGEIIDPEGDCTFSLDGDKLTVSMPGKEHILDAERNRMNAPRVLQDVTGDFVVRVKVAGTFPPGETSLVRERKPFQGAGLLLWQDEKNYIRLERAQLVIGGQTRSYVSWELRSNGQFVRVGNADEYPLNGEQPWLKLERQGNKISAFVSSDGVQWSPLEPIVYNFPKTVRVGISAGHNTPTPLTVEFEGFKLKTNAPTVNPNKKPNPNSSTPNRNSSSHQGYCTFLPAAGFGGKIVNDRCLITQINNNTYQLRWSNGRQMSINLNPASIDGNSGQLIHKKATSATVKTYQGRVGFCWNCRP